MRCGTCPACGGSRRPGPCGDGARRSATSTSWPRWTIRCAVIARLDALPEVEKVLSAGTDKSSIVLRDGSAGRPDGVPTDGVGDAPRPLHRQPRPQHRAARHGARPRLVAVREGLQGHRGRLAARCRRGGGRLRAPRAALDRAGAARGRWRDRGRDRRPPADAWSPTTTCEATPTRTRTGPMAWTRSRSWPGPRAIAATSTSSSPITRRRSASLAASLRRAWRSRRSRSPGSTPSWPRSASCTAPSSRSEPTRPSTTPTSCCARFDVVIASIHTGRGQSSEQLTRRALAAVEHPHVDILAHPSGRIVNRRDPLPIDWPRVFEAAARTGTALEINGSPRLDLDDSLARAAASAGARLTLASDAHRTEELGQQRYAVDVARRAWLEPDQLLATRAADELLELSGDQPALRRSAPARHPAARRSPRRGAHRRRSRRSWRPRAGSPRAGVAGGRDRGAAGARRAGGRLRHRSGPSGLGSRAVRHARGRPASRQPSSAA